MSENNYNTETSKFPMESTDEVLGKTQEAGGVRGRDSPERVHRT